MSLKSIYNYLFFKSLSSKVKTTKFFMNLDYLIYENATLLISLIPSRHRTTI